MKRERTLFGLTLHMGHLVRGPTRMKLEAGRYRFMDVNRINYTVYTITKLWGVSLGHKWFLGFVSLNSVEFTNEREEPCSEKFLK